MTSFLKLLILATIYITYPDPTLIASDNPNAHEVDNKVSANIISDIESAHVSKFLEIKIKFTHLDKSSLGKLQIENHGAYLQLVFENTIAVNSGKFYNLENAPLTKAAVFESGDNRAILRLFSNQGLDQIATNIEINPIKDGLAISVPNNIASPLKSADTKKEFSNSDPMAFLKQDINLSKYTEVGAYLAALLLVFLVVYIKLRPYFGRPKNSVTSDRSESTEKGLSALSPFSKRKSPSDNQIKKLDTMTIAPKQKITLIEVAGQKILLSTNVNGTSLITNIQPEIPGPQMQPTMHRIPNNPAMTLDMQRQVPSGREINNSGYTGEKPTANQNNAHDPGIRSKTPKTSKAVEGVLKQIMKRRISDQSAHDDMEKYDQNENNEGPNSITQKSTNTENRPQKTIQKSRYNIAIGDDGIQDVANEEDITQILRSKLTGNRSHA